MRLRLAWFLALAFAAPANAQQLAHEADLDVSGDGLAMLVLPPEVIAAVRPDLADVRIVDRAGREVPFAVHASRPPTDVRSPLTAMVLDVDHSQDTSAENVTTVRERYRLASIRTSLEAHGLPWDSSAAWALDFDIARPEYVVRVSVSDGDARVLVENAGVFRVASGEVHALARGPNTTKTRVSLPPHEGELTVEVTSALRDAAIARPFERPLALAPRFEFVPISAARENALAVVPLGEPRITPQAGATELRFARPLGLVPGALRIAAEDAAFSRSVSVLDVAHTGEERAIGGGAIVRAPGAAEALDVPLREPARGSELRVQIEDRDSPALRGVRVSALLAQPALVFALTDHADAQPDGALRFGGGQALRPDYDLASLAELFPNAALLDHALAAIEPGATKLGAIRANPSFAPAPALEFAMQPGAALDASRFRSRRALTIGAGANGLSRYRLAPEDIAAARADLADVRVVGADGAQWPLLLAPEGAREWRDVALVSEASDRERRSRYALMLPAAGVRVTALELETSAPFFDRTYQVTTRDERGAARVLASGRIARAPERPRPVRIALAGERVAQLALEIEDGDDAPLAFTRASAQLVLPELYVTAPPGEYALLLGDPEASAPEYELERVREFVLAVPSAVLQASALGANPAFSPARTLASGVRGQTLAVWLVLGLALAALAALTLRAARREDPPPAA